MKIRIDRKKWMRGAKNNLGHNERSFMNYLFVKEQNAGCCLGHFIHQTTKCGWEKLNNLSTPEEYYTKANKKNPLVIDAVSYEDITNSPFACRAMGINDCLNINDEQREEQLKDLFFSEGYILEFYN